MRFPVIMFLFVLLSMTPMSFGSEEGREAGDYITTPYPVILLSANDGEMRFKHTPTGLQQAPVQDSMTVVRLGPDHPPVVKTVAGTVPVTIFGSPRVAISADGRYGFVSSHAWRPASSTDSEAFNAPSEPHRNVLTVIDLAADDLQVVDQLELPATPWMVGLHPDGKQVVVSVGAGFHIYALENGHLALKGEAAAPALVQSFDISPRGDRIIAVTLESIDNQHQSAPQLHLFSLQGNTITHLQRIEAAADVGPVERLFSPRFSPDAKRAVVLHDFGEGGKGTLDDVLIIDLAGDTATIAERVPQVADGLEDVAFHPSGGFVVVCCLESGIDGTSVGHLAVIDLTSRPAARLVSHTPIELVPEGICFTADGSQLFVGATTAQHIAVFDVKGMSLHRNPLVLRTGHGPAALALGVQVSFFDSQGVRIAYTDAGHGEPIVMVAGFGSLEGWLANPLYRQLVDAGYRVIVLDCRGHGRSDKPHDAESYGPEMADDVVRLLDHLKIARAHVMGYSMGGDIAHKLRERHADRLISCIAGGVGRYSTDGWAAVEYDLTRLADSLERGEGVVEYLCLPLTVGQPALSQRDAEDANQWFMKGNDPLAMAAWVRSYGRLTVSTESLENNTVPTLLIVGEFDPEKLDADKLKDVMANLEYVVIPGENHFTAGLTTEFRERILNFLEQHHAK